MKIENELNRIISSFAPQTEANYELLAKYIEFIVSNPDIDVNNKIYDPITHIIESIGISKELRQNPEFKKILANKHCKILLQNGFTVKFVEEIFKSYKACELIISGSKILDNKIPLDSPKLEIIQKLLTFLITQKSLMLEFAPSEKITDRVTSYYMSVEIDLFANILNILNNLSTETKENFSDNLEPKPFLWEDFEQLEELLKHDVLKIPNVVFNNIIGKREILDSLNNELLAKHNIIKAAFVSIKKDDLPELLKLTKDISISIKNPKYIHENSPKINLFAMKAIRNRIIDQETISRLIYLSSDYSNRNIHSKTDIYAALNYLVKIGELCRAKYLSSKTQKLSNKESFFLHLVKIRDAIIYQNVSSNKNNIDALINKPDLLNSIMIKELPKLTVYIIDLLEEIYKESTCLRNNIQNFWEEIYSQERQGINNADNNFLKTPFTKEQDAIFDLVKGENKELADKLMEFFKGNNVFNQSDQELVINIINSKIKKYKSEEFLKCLHVAIEQTQQRFITLQYDWKKDFQNIAYLYDHFYEKKSENIISDLTELEKIHASKNAIDQIIEILKFNFEDDKGDLLETFSNLVKDNHNILEATQYNIIQALQQLDSARNKINPTVLHNYSNIGSSFDKELLPRLNHIISSKMPNTQLYANNSVEYIFDTLLILIKNVRPELENLSEKLLNQNNWQNYIEKQNKYEYGLKI